MAARNSGSTPKLELYKRYRPSRWDELVGQQKVAHSIQAALAANRVPTAYGFFGPRGCGKTSAAFILAKSLNCLNLQDGQNPCNECDVCHAIDDRSQPGVQYISMANHGSVDHIRELMRDSSQATYINRAVIIMDEVHNISRNAFDSMLTTIEDEHTPALMIFCSTEEDKIPDTIISRLQARTFRLVNSDDMIGLVSRILDEEDVSVSDEALLEVIQRGRGSVRDTLSVLEGLIVGGDLLERPAGLGILEALAALDVPGCLKAVKEGADAGYSGRTMAEGLFSDLVNIIQAVSGVRGVAPPVRDVQGFYDAMGGLRGLFAVEREVGDAINRMSIGADSLILFQIALFNALDKLRDIRDSADKK